MNPSTRQFTPAADQQAGAEARESIVVEAPTVEAALEAVAAQMGTDCRILAVDKVSRGGIAGFFGKETYQVEVEKPARVQLEDLTPQDAAREAVDRVLEAADHGSDEMFGDVLRSRLGVPTAEPEPFDGIDLTALEDLPAPPLPPTPSAAPQPEQSGAALNRLRGAIEEERAKAVIPEPMPEPEPPAVGAPPPEAPMQVQVQSQPEAPPQPTQPRRSRTRSTDPGGREVGEPIFTADHLVRTGLPFSFVVQLGDLSTLDDLSRLVQLANALQPWCGPLPRHDTLVVGLRADRLSTSLGIDVHGPSDPVPTEGSAIWVCNPNDAATDAYLRQIRGTRGLHVVDPTPETLASLDAGTIVSWSDPEIGFDALLFALERGLHLGFNVSGADARRATSVEMAIGIRSRLPLSGS